MMEHRLHARRAADFSVRLVQGGQVIAIVQAIDISSDGLRVECPDVILNNGQRVDVDFFKSGHPRGIRRIVPSMVVHAGPNAVGLILAYDL